MLRGVATARFSIRVGARSFAIVLAALSFALPLVARAQPSPTERTRIAAALPVRAKPKTSFVADLGFLSTTGNTEVTTISASEKLTHPEGFWRFETVPNLETSDDWRINTESSVVAPLSKRTALKVGYVLRYDNLPETGFQNTERFLTTGLQLSF